MLRLHAGHGAGQRPSRRLRLPRRSRGRAPRLRPAEIARGDLKGYWSISISGNWRMIFRFEDGDVHDVDLVDYH
ncbi:MAG: hypothetical protein F4204_11075 [Rhodospirillaceae bacterium]|nr:hypothetical protein [Rhodospirillaceae bacterium]